MLHFESHKCLEIHYKFCKCHVVVSISSSGMGSDVGKETQTVWTKLGGFQG